ncbi:MAG: BLUF domain-containing protein [Pseudomonadota bacterium]
MVDKPRAAVPINGRSKSGEDGLYSLSYVSTQTAPLNNEQLLNLLMQARQRNNALNITGLLLHRDDSFFQVLEGDRDVVSKLYEKICLDQRHHRVEVVSEGDVTSREYDDWQMAFIELDGQDFSALPGFSDVLKNTPAARDFLHSLSRSKKLALLFSILD